MTDNHPLAYLLTFRPHGSWLPGRDGWIDKAHNQFDTPALPADDRILERAKLKMSEDPFSLDAAHRRVVRAAILEVCRHNGWQLHAVHVRTTHVHAVVSGPGKPEPMLKRTKAICTQRLHEGGMRRERIWSRHGSTPYLWNEESLRAAIEYVLNGQGEPMERWPESEPPA